MTQPSVALTDWALAAECAIFTWVLLRDEAADSELRRWFSVLFSALCVASLLGGIVHAFFADPSSRGHARVWPGVLLSIGVASLAGWMLGARLSAPGRVARFFRWLAWGQLTALAWTMTFVTQRFWISIASYLPAASLLLFGFARAWSHTRARSLAWGALGLVLTFVAAALQQRRIGLHPMYLDHNALYHVLQGVGLLGVFLGARAVIGGKTHADA